MSEKESDREALMKRIAGEIVLSENPGQVLRKWRVLFNISQKRIASEIGCSPSVISDYEKGRRHAPGSVLVRRFVTALVEIDEKTGGTYLRGLASISPHHHEAILDMKEFAAPVKLWEIKEAVRGEILTGEESLDLDVFGYTIIDSIKAIEMLSGVDFYRIFGSTSVRALVFTQVTKGRSPMIAVKISPFKPRLVVLHGKLRRVDDLAVQLARGENVPLVLSRASSVQKLVQDLNSLYRKTLQSRPLRE